MRRRALAVTLCVLASHALAQDAPAAAAADPAKPSAVGEGTPSISVPRVSVSEVLRPQPQATFMTAEQAQRAAAEAAGKVGSVSASVPEFKPEIGQLGAGGVKFEDRPVPVPVDRPVPIPVQVDQRPAPFSIRPSYDVLPIFQRPDPIIPSSVLPQPMTTDSFGNPTYPYLAGSAPEHSVLQAGGRNMPPLDRFAGKVHPFAPLVDARERFGQNPLTPSLSAWPKDYTPSPVPGDAALAALDRARSAELNAQAKEKQAGAPSFRFRQMNLPNGMSIRAPEDALKGAGFAPHPMIPGALAPSSASSFGYGWAPGAVAPGSGLSEPAGVLAANVNANNAAFAASATSAAAAAAGSVPSFMPPLPTSASAGAAAAAAAAPSFLPPLNPALPPLAPTEQDKAAAALAQLTGFPGLDASTFAQGLSGMALPTAGKYGLAVQHIADQEQRTRAAMLRAQQEAEVRAQYVNRVSSFVAQQQMMLRNALHQEHLQREFLAQMHRRMAALEVDKRRVAAEYDLAGLMSQYQKVQAEEDALRAARVREAAIKADLIKRINGVKDTIRSASSTIDALITGKPEANETARATQAEQEEKRAFELAEHARKVQEEADRASVVAAQQFAAQMQADAIANVFPGSAAAGSAANATQPAPAAAAAAAAPAAAPAPAAEAPEASAEPAAEAA